MTSSPASSHPLRIGLTGGVGSGKSTAAAQFAALGAHVVDADVIAREVVAPGTVGFDHVVQAFGDEVVAADGSLNRRRLAEIVFADPATRQRLNAIVHPLVSRRTVEIVGQLSDVPAIVHDVPLLVENDLMGAYDVVVVVDAPEALRLERLLAKGLPAEQARSRIAAQASREDRLAAADFVLDNSGTPAELAEQVERLWRELLH